MFAPYFLRKLPNTGNLSRANDICVSYRRGRERRARGDSRWRRCLRNQLKPIARTGRGTPLETRRGYALQQAMERIPVRIGQLRNNYYQQVCASSTRRHRARKRG